MSTTAALDGMHCMPQSLGAFGNDDDLLGSLTSSLALAVSSGNTLQATSSPRHQALKTYVSYSKRSDARHHNAQNTNLCPEDQTLLHDCISWQFLAVLQLAQWQRCLRCKHNLIVVFLIPCHCCHGQGARAARPPAGTAAAPALAHNPPAAPRCHPGSPSPAPRPAPAPPPP